MKHIPYTYLIGWHKHDLWYYGSQYGKRANPENLWKTYFTSSKRVKYLRQKLGEPDVIEVRKIFSVAEAAYDWETRVLTRMKVLTNKKFVNMTTNISFTLTDEIKQKIGAANKGRFKGKTYEEMYGEESSKKLRALRSKSATGKDNSNEKNPMYGKAHTKESIEKMRANKPLTAPRGGNHHLFGKQRTEEVKQKIRDSLRRTRELKRASVS